MSEARRARPPRGVIAWMISNRVTPNLLMVFLLLGGLFMLPRIKKEVFPEYELDTVTVQVSYPGASPEEVERGVVLVVEEAIRGLDGVKEVTATAGEGSGRVTAELQGDADGQKLYQDIQQEVKRITTFPEDSEEPQITLDARRRNVLNLQIYGAADERILREAAEQVRDRLLQRPDITQIELSAVRDIEIHVELSQEILRSYGLTLDDVAQRIRSASVELPGGRLETAGGEVLLRVKDRHDWAREFARIPVVTTASGTVLTLDQFARVREDFEDTNRLSTYNGQRSISVDVFRVGEQTPTGVSAAVREAMLEIQADLPPGIDWAINSDRSTYYQQRMDLLLKNAALGLCLVMVLLGLFLEVKLAFWVTMGIPTSFLGGLLFLPLLGISINIISMFAFIVALGIVVDDAIVAGENIFEYRNQGLDLNDAANLGAKDVAIPITYSILTNIVAFLPIYFIPGTLGKVWQAIPVVVITVFLISWVESLVILPAHLAHSSRKPPPGPLAWFRPLREQVSVGLNWYIKRVYAPFLAVCLRHYLLTVAVSLAFLIVLAGYVFSGRIGLILMPRVESDRAVVTATLPYGSPEASALVVQDRLISAMEAVAEEHGGDQLLEGIFAQINENQVEVSAYLQPPGMRPLTTRDVAKLWRERTGSIAGLEALRYESDRGGPGSGASLTVELSHRDIDVLDRASADLAARLMEFPNVEDVNDGYTPGKRQFDFRLTDAGRSLGLTSSMVARQVRSAFFGAEALKQQRGRNEVTVRVRLPERQRTSEYDIESLQIRTPAGTYVPLFEVAEVSRGRAYTAIQRRDGRRTVSVTGDVEPIGETGQVLATLTDTVLPQLARDYPGLIYSFEGRQADLKESLSSLYGGFALAMVGIFFLLAIPFRSYIQPLIVMVAIPFGIAGSVLGHMLMGYNLSLMSMMGIIALSGVVVNDSLLLIDYANGARRRGEDALNAITSAGARRFRPVLLTTLTTFGGLAPMIFETSRQARFMIPMAISLGFGILFATAVTLIIVPSLYLIIEKFRKEPSAG